MSFYLGFVCALLAFAYRPALWTEITLLCLTITAVITPVFFGSKLIYWVFVYPFYRSPLRNLPGPSDNTFFLGQSTKFLKVSWLPYLFVEWSKIWPDAPFIRYLNFANSETLLASNVVAYREILQTKAKLFVKPAFARTFAHEIIGDGLPFVEGAIHKLRRAVMTRPFLVQCLRRNIDAIQSKASQLGDILGHKVGPGCAVIDMLDVICIETLSVDLNHVESDVSPLYMAFSKTMQPTTLGHLINYINSIIPIRKYLPMKEAREFRRYYDEARIFVRLFVTSRLEGIKVGEEDLPNDALQGLVSHTDSNWNIDAIVESVINLLVLGHDTTACSITWAIHELSKRQYIQQRIRSEILNLRHAGASVEKGQYLQSFVMEVLRHHCAVPMAPREAIVDMEIAGTFIPQGTVIQLSPAIVNLHPSIWGEDAQEFNPDRWLAKEGPHKNKFAFETFHNGPRMCIGKNLTIIEMKIMLAELVSRFQIDAYHTGPIEIASPSFTLRPKEKLLVHLRKL
ncbi:cytochrome P450 [Thelonectria olida]|uniref:Cytochrome P450 n=1 Tax=Thelonectria olida TaxID=1576542 RepID=A0A9P8WFR9_9HYPO|nr:cytochrome P450 [Thelonectria olida]